MKQDANEFLMSAGVPSVKLSKIGDKVTGVLLKKAELQQIRDYVEGTPLTWEDGNPKMQLVITLQTDMQDSEIENDDGIRNLYAKAQLQVALRQAIRTAGAGRIGLEVGCRLTVEVIELKANANPKLKPQKIHKVIYERPTNDTPETDDLDV